MKWQQKLDEAIEQALDTTAETLRQRGATPDEIERELTIQRAEVARQRVEWEAEVQRWLDEPNAPTLRLQ